MKKSSFKPPKLVLIFNGAQKLISIVCSLNTTADLTGFGTQAVACCCLGKSISSYGYYFRYVEPDKIEITLADLGKLTLKEYDQMSNLRRNYHPVREMKKKRIAQKIKQTKSKQSDNEIL